MIENLINTDNIYNKTHYKYKSSEMNKPSKIFENSSRINNITNTNDIAIEEFNIQRNFN